MTVFFTSDLHLNHGRTSIADDHTGILKFCPKTRPYPTVREMNRDIIDKINSVVTDNDTLYILGDFCFRHTQEELEYWFHAIRGKKRLCIGNHDGDDVRRLPWDDVQYGYVEHFGGHLDGKKKRKMVTHINHHPFVAGQWQDAHKGSYHLFGHVHGKRVYTVPVRALDVGIDSIGPVPISYEEIDERFQKIPVVVEHH